MRHTGTHLWPLLGQPATGRCFGYDGAAFFHAPAGRLSSVWVLGDLASLSEQLAAPEHCGAESLCDERPGS